MKEINLNTNPEDKVENETTYDDEIASVDRIPEKIYEKVPGTTRLQKLTTISFISICLVICIFCIRVFSHIKTMSDYEIPEDAVIAEESDISEEEEDVDYVEQVTYSPTEAAMAELANANNGHDWSIAFTCPFTWSFKSDYKYDSAKINCVWLCTNDDTGELIAIRVATYNGSDNTFSDASVYTTLIGGKYIAAD